MKETANLKMRPPHELRVQDMVDSSSFGTIQKSTSGAYMGTIGGASIVNWISK